MSLAKESRTDNSVVSTVKLTGQPPSVRHDVLSLVKELVEGHTTSRLRTHDLAYRSTLTAVFKYMGSEFLTSFTKFVEGEKDPRNLMLLFNLENSIIRTFNIKDNVQVRSCEDALTVGSVRRHVLLLPGAVPTTAQRPLRHHMRRPTGGTAAMPVCHVVVRASSPPPVH